MMGASAFGHDLDTVLTRLQPGTSGRTRVITDGEGRWREPRESGYIGLDRGDWTFEDPAVADNFDRHVREQLPWYDMATGVIAHVARHVLPASGLAYDIGASTGNVSRSLEPVASARGAHVVGIEASEPMFRAWKGYGEIRHADAIGFQYEECDLAVSFLALMFMPVAKRGHLLSQIFGRLRPGGALVLFERMEPEGGAVGLLSSRLTLAAKYEAGARPEEIIAKELALAGVQRPLHPAELKRCPFVPIFRFGDFAGFVAMKTPQ